MKREWSLAGTFLPFRGESIHHASVYLLPQSEAVAPSRRYGLARANRQNKAAEQRGEEQRGKEATALR